MSISLFANNIQTTLATSITSSQTSVTLVSATGLPNPTSGQYFVMTFTNGATNEVVWVTNVTGSVITCIRAREGTSASSFASGSFASCFPTAGTMQNIVQIDQLQNGSYTFANGAGTANALTATISSNLTVVPNGFQFIINAANATEAVPLKHWSGNVCCYHEKQIVTDEDRKRLYEGVKVKCKGDVFVLSGQRIDFSPDRSKPAAAQPTQMALF